MFHLFSRSTYLCIYEFIMINFGDCLNKVRCSRTGQNRKENKKIHILYMRLHFTVEVSHNHLLVINNNLTHHNILLLKY